MRALCLILTMAGAAVMVFSAVRYHRLIRLTREESYDAGPYRGRVIPALGQLALLFFIIGFGVGGADVLLREVEPIYFFVVVVFFVGALFITTLIQHEISMADSLRAKTNEVMNTFANAVETKHPYTQGHARHVHDITAAFCDTLPSAIRRRINRPKLLDAALLHDIGKIGVDNEILNKKGALTPADWDAIRTHPVLGEKMLNDTCFVEISPWVLYHHERVDGQGYLKLPGDQIPLESRILAIADTYSAITTDREYRPRQNHDRAISIMREAAGTQLDAGLVALFCTIPAEKLAPGMMDSACA